MPLLSPKLQTSVVHGPPRTPLASARACVPGTGPCRPLGWLQSRDDTCRHVVERFKLGGAQTAKPGARSKACALASSGCQGQPHPGSRQPDTRKTYPAPVQKRPMWPDPAYAAQLRLKQALPHVCAGSETAAFTLHRAEQTRASPGGKPGEGGMLCKARGAGSQTAGVSTSRQLPHVCRSSGKRHHTAPCTRICKHRL